MANERNKRISKTVDMAVEIFKEKPHLKYAEALQEAKQKIAAEENKFKKGCKYEI